MVKKIIYILLVLTALVAAFLCGGFLYHPNSVEASFNIYPGDDLCVARTLIGFEWQSYDSAIVAKVDYMQIGEDDSCYKLLLTENGRSNTYYGGVHMNKGDDVYEMICGDDVYYFANEDDGSLIVIFWGEMSCMVLHNDTIPMLFISRD